ncbi:MAG: response regulator [Archangiaceae bacterium]|nr:response regulator [Archangiaceae bacterium]
MTELARILCVDDEPAVLEGLELHLRRKFTLTTATSGAEALEKMKGLPPFAAIVSDMRMPGMSGAEFLKAARASAPDTVRLLLTGHADVPSAVSAVNDGQIFRFLTKPCSPPQLMLAVETAVHHHRLITAERELLEKTLRGTVKMVADVLALANPLAFGKVTRAKALVEVLLKDVAPDEVWKADVACLFTHLGAVNLPHSTLERWYRGETLEPGEKAEVDKLPQQAEALLAHIPRLEGVRELVASVARGDPPQRAPMGARAVRLAYDFDALCSKGDAPAMAFETLKLHAASYDSALLAALGKHLDASHGPKVREVTLREVRAGMVLTEDLKTKNGVLLVPRGFEVTAALQARFSSMAEGAVKEPIRVSIK